jgi:hypothetical protein
VFRKGLVEVKGGLVASDVVLTRGHTDLIDGAVVRLEAQPLGAGTPVACNLDERAGERANCEGDATQMVGRWAAQP